MRRTLFLKPFINVQQYVEMLNDLNCYLLFSDEFPEQLDQNQVIKILDQTKSPEWHEAMMDANIDTFKMSYERFVSYFKCLENLGKIRRTNSISMTDTLPLDK